ncbi:uncharacterized protein EV420DRAFT_1743952 [Desarmillaria tabescens]|uniref:Uncharacterized protein n=1 Tax=Armillaria tabescens TaxID=1929756 RepID=A0AA39NI79_ARMTA|nr:uncharacterized protein EV420DRAFT_1743952 [Desarmillaria tabescens]KAK0466117.1 hypothetical protein EV420DRAFT_1743952 [Desarmillaria tabescens]
MITVSHDHVSLNMRHHCRDITVHPCRPLINADFMAAAALITWPDLNPIDIADDDDEEDEEDSQVTHLVVHGDYHNLDDDCPLHHLTSPLPSLHTLQLNSVAIKPPKNLEYNLDDLQRLCVWNSRASPQGLYLLVRSTTTLTHFAFGGEQSRVEEDSDASHDFAVPPPSFPPTLQYLHLNVCAIVSWEGNPLRNPLRPRMLSWLACLKGPIAIKVFECKVFTNDVRIPRKIISLGEATLTHQWGEGRRIRVAGYNDVGISRARIDDDAVLSWRECRCNGQNDFHHHRRNSGIGSAANRERVSGNERRDHFLSESVTLSSLSSQGFGRMIALREREREIEFWQGQLQDWMPTKHKSTGQIRHTEDYEVKHLEENRGRQVKICERETTHVQDREYRRDTMFSGIRKMQK